MWNLMWFIAVIRMLFASAITAFILHKGTKSLSGLCEMIPHIESLTFIIDRSICSTAHPQKLGHDWYQHDLHCDFWRITTEWWHGNGLVQNPFAFSEWFLGDQWRGLYICHDALSGGHFGFSVCWFNFWNGIHFLFFSHERLPDCSCGSPHVLLLGIHPILHLQGV